MGKYFITLIIGIMFVSCKMNKTVELYPIEPFQVIENNIIFSIPQKQPLWIGFQWPLVKRNPDSYFNMNIKSNQNIKNLYLKSISINFKELNFQYTKNMMLYIQNMPNLLSNQEYLFNGQIEGTLFTINELLNDYNPDISLVKLYRKFKKINKIEYYITMEYISNDQYYETILVWKYKIKKRTSFARLDAVMGI